MDPNNNNNNNNNNNSIAAIDLLLQVRMLLEIILHPTSCLAVIQNWQSFYNTRTPEKLMLFTSTGWVDLPSKNAEEIKKCFEHRCMATKIEIGGVEVVANLIGMILIDSCSRMTSIAWIDTEGKSFFPKKMYGGGRVRSLVPQILEEARVSFGSLLDLRKMEESNDEYKTVKQTFMKGMKPRDHRETAEVTAVYSCTHASRFGANWRWAFGRIAQIGDNYSNLTCGWYGADAQSLKNIITRGFGLEDALIGKFGTGIYFSSKDRSALCACLSKPDADGEYHVLLCQLILGTAERVTPGSKQYGPSREGYDNGVDAQLHTKYIVIWSANMSTHIIPRYLLSFKISQLIQERWRRVHYKQSLNLQRLPTPIPLRSQTLLPRGPRYMERYQRNKQFR